MLEYFVTAVIGLLFINELVVIRVMLLRWPEVRRRSFILRKSIAYFFSDLLGDFVVLVVVVRCQLLEPKHLTLLFVCRLRCLEHFGLYGFHFFRNFSVFNNEL